MTTEQSILSGVNLRKQFRLKSSPASPSGLLTALDGVTIDVARGETLGIAGESGCGKSTLGKILAGLLKPDSGEVRFLGSPITTLSSDASGAFRRKTQMIFQDPFSSLNPRMRVGDIIGEPLVIAGTGPAAVRRSTVEGIMATVGLTAEHYHRFPHEFSGGQRQRIGIARALAASPDIIIADEPVSSLDISIQAQIINLLQEMKVEYRLSLAIISHDLSVLRHICDRVVIMYLGIIVESAPAAELFRRCLHPYAEALLAAIPTINPSEQHTRHILKDDLPSPMAIPGGCRFHPRCRYAEAVCRTHVPPLEEKQPGHFAACHLSTSIFGV
jgi:peptide/nickel transport system ATP-binding protein